MVKAHYIQNIYLSFVRDFHDNEHDNFHKQLFDAYEKKYLKWNMSIQISHLFVKSYHLLLSSYYLLYSEKKESLE